MTVGQLPEAILKTGKFSLPLDLELRKGRLAALPTHLVERVNTLVTYGPSV